MTDRPIIFSAPMVKALLAGTKTQTRRILKDQPGDLDRPFMMDDGSWHTVTSRGTDMSPIGVRLRVGDRLWVREACRAEELSRPQTSRPATRLERESLGRTSVLVVDELDGADGVRFLADDTWQMIRNTQEAGDTWSALFHYRGRGNDRVGKPVSPVHMPRWASRLTLTVTDVRVERLQDISEEDALAEGLSRAPGGWWSGAEGQAGTTPKAAYAVLWNSLHGPDAWRANPWVAAVTFSVEQRNINVDCCEAADA